jgi:hypothetical protein
MNRRPLLLLALLALSLTLGACNKNAHGGPGGPGVEPLTLTLNPCSANVPATETSDGTIRCTPLTLTLPNH